MASARAQRGRWHGWLGQHLRSLLSHSGSPCVVPQRNREMNVAFLGYGTVGKAVDLLLQEKRAELEAIGINVAVTGIASRRIGWTVGDKKCRDINEWLV